MLISHLFLVHLDTDEARGSIEAYKPEMLGW